jgi:hypothetical protein
VPHPLFDRHRTTLERALTAIAERTHWSAFPESASPKVRGEGAAEAGKAAFAALRDKPLRWTSQAPLARPALSARLVFRSASLTRRRTSTHCSPWWLKPNPSGAKPDLKRGPVSAPEPQRINRQSFVMANAVMHTTGQAFLMAFQAAGPPAQDRGPRPSLMRGPTAAFRQNRCGKNRKARTSRFEWKAISNARVSASHWLRILMECYRVFRRPRNRQRGRGEAASRRDPATGDHGTHRPRGARRSRLHPNVVTLVAHAAGDDTAQMLALRPDVKLIDFTGSTANGDWLEANARQATVFTEKAGVNQIIVDSAADFQGIARNVAFSLALYTGQMCTAPQNIYVPRDGIDTADGHLTFDQVATGLATAVQKLLADPVRAVEILGAVVNEGVAMRLKAARTLGPIVLDTQAIAHPQFPEAISTPLIVKPDAADRDKYLQEWFDRSRLSLPPAIPTKVRYCQRCNRTQGR